MKVGDLIADKEYPDEFALIIDKRDSDVGTYRILNYSGSIMWLEREYVEDYCEVISEGR